MREDLRNFKRLMETGEIPTIIGQPRGTCTGQGKREGEKETETKHYLHQGIAGRSFERRFQLAENVEVRGAQLENGLLHVDLEHVVPEEKRPRRIAIGAKPEGKVIDAKVKAA